MSLAGHVFTNGFRYPLITASGDHATPLTVPAAGTTTYTIPVSSAQVSFEGAEYVALQSVFTYGSGGTSAKVYLQTSLDGGLTWVDIISHAFATTTASKISACSAGIAPAAQGYAPTDGSLTDNTIIQGTTGNLYRAKLIVVGTYSSTTLRCDLNVKG